MNNQHKQYAGEGHPHADYTLAEQFLPDIAGTFVEIQRYSRVPVMIRLDYLNARGEALYATGTGTFSKAFSAAMTAKLKVWEEMRA